ncbi:hypothetical protein PZB74_18300 [Porifericola rhodea]|uniref:hypothetical protein n=1 Tax=Porifericola rhodea TaxID=930972 RepID=UPI00266589FE|nr:hypothetical protein [Porifericola rhodea]WKN30909.1 hypothetical protein PZB74_18300 [Porifericola rhodea]
MRTPPEAYLIFKEELKKVELEKARLKEVYESKLSEMNEELGFLKEQIMSQQDMMKTTIEYATKLEDELSSLKKQIREDKSKQKNSFH